MDSNVNRDTASTPPAPQRKPYQPPKLLVHGDLLSLTRGGDPTSTNDMDGSSTGMFSGGTNTGGSTMSMN